MGSKDGGIEERGEIRVKGRGENVEGGILVCLIGCVDRTECSVYEKVCFPPVHRASSTC